MKKDEAEQLSRKFRYPVEEIMEMDRVISRYRYIVEKEFTDEDKDETIRFVMFHSDEYQLSPKSLLGYILGLWR